MRIFRNILIGAVALFLSALLTVVFPLLNQALKGDRASRSPRIVAQVALKQMESARQDQQPRRKLKQPQRSRPMQTMAKAGPRFAMDLSVGGLGGASVPVDIVNRPGGGGGQDQGENGDVDEKPQPTAPPPFRLPPDIKSAVLSFCVDPSGRPYEVRVVEEKPSGMGLAEAGREALRQTPFQPARKGGLPVAFCGLEQPFEVRFNN
jgi:protein TonB